MSPVPPSQSIYRGQSRTGRGEGPGRTVLHGEQYLHVDPELYDAELLALTGPWLTLDSDPSDHQRLHDRLEGWSIFSTAEYLFVARLTSAGSYDHRAAYFSHARVWKRATLPRGFDPGLNLGREGAFAAPWRDAQAPQERFESLSSLVRPDQIQAEVGTAALFLAHLLQAMVLQSALIISAPIQDFESGSALHALVSLARAGLPAGLRDQCTVRVYSRFPDLFVRHLRAHLVVVPDDTATAASMARPAATVLGRDGKPITGPKLDDKLHDYAKRVVDRAVDLPDGLAQFSARYPFDPRSVPSGKPARAAVRITYNVAYALGGPPATRGQLLAEFLPKAASTFGPGLDWNRFIRPEEWKEFPRELLLDQLLNDALVETEGGRELLRAIEEGVSSCDLRVDERLESWWEPNHDGKLRRLIELLSHNPPLVSARAVAERTIHLPLERLAACGPLSHVLRAEAEADWLRERTQAGELATYATDPGVFETLMRAVSAGRINTEWAQIFVKKATPQGLIDAAQQWLRDPSFWRDWGSVPNVLLDRLRSLEPAPIVLRPLIEDGCHLDPVADLKLHLRLADLRVRIDKAEGRNTDDRLISRVGSVIPQLSPQDRSFIENIFFDSEWQCLQLQRLSLADLLQFATLFRNEASFEKLHRELDTRMRRDPAATTRVLVRANWWHFWRRRSQLRPNDRADAEVLRKGAFEWLLAASQTETTLEAWEQVLDDLPQQLTGSDLARLRENGSSTLWPRVAPFEEQQLEQLAGKAADLGALAEIADAATGSAFPGDVHDHVLSASGFAGKLSGSALRWLSAAQQDRNDLPVLTLTESLFLFEHAGHRTDRALDARMRSVEKQLNEHRTEALAAASSANLWQNAAFLTTLATWIARQGSVSAIGKEALAIIEKNLGATQASKRPSAETPFLERLYADGWKKTTRLLDPDFGNRADGEMLTKEVVDALINRRVTHPCWNRLAEAIKRHVTEKEGAEGAHPLDLIARSIATAPLTLPQRNTLAIEGWNTFERVAGNDRALTAPPAASQPGLPLFNLAAAMLGAGAMGQAAVRVRNLVDESYRREVTWWRRLLVSLHGFRRHGHVRSAEDREGLALACIIGSLAGAPDEIRTLRSAMSIEAKTNPDWTLLSEFGVDYL